MLRLSYLVGEALGSGGCAEVRIARRIDDPSPERPQDVRGPVAIAVKVFRPLHPLVSGAEETYRFEGANATVVIDPSPSVSSVQVGGTSREFGPFYPDLASAFECRARLMECIGGGELCAFLKKPSAGDSMALLSLAEGSSLHALSQEKRSLAEHLRLTWQINQRVCSVLARMHAEGIVHRDPSPKNILAQVDGPVVRGVTLLDLDGLVECGSGVTSVYATNYGTLSQAQLEFLVGQETEYVTKAADDCEAWGWHWLSTLPKLLAEQIAPGLFLKSSEPTLEGKWRVKEILALREAGLNFNKIPELNEWIERMVSAEPNLSEQERADLKHLLKQHVLLWLGLTDKEPAVQAFALNQPLLFNAPYSGWASSAWDHVNGDSPCEA